MRIDRRFCVFSSFASDIRMQVERWEPLPILPLSWWSCDRPNLSAFSMTIMTEFGTSMPTSITVVETKSCVSPQAKESMTAFLSAGFILPCSSPSLKPLKKPSASSLYSPSAAVSSETSSPSSTRGQTM